MWSWTWQEESTIRWLTTRTFPCVYFMFLSFGQDGRAICATCQSVGRGATLFRVTAVDPVNVAANWASMASCATSASLCQDVSTAGNVPSFSLYFFVTHGERADRTNKRYRAQSRPYWLINEPINPGAYPWPHRSLGNKSPTRGNRRPFPTEL